MSFNVYTTDFFDREIKRLAKKYPSVKNDFKGPGVFVKERTQARGNRLERIVTKFAWR